MSSESIISTFTHSLPEKNDPDQQQSKKIQVYTIKSGDTLSRVAHDF